MYIKKILLFISLIGLVLMSIFSYFVYVTMFVSNTNFNNEFAYVYVYSDQNFEELKEDLSPVLKNVNSFERLAIRKGYNVKLKPGKFAIKNGMNNNEIINNLRSSKLTVDVIFNNIDNEYELAGKIAAQIEADSLSLINSFKDLDFFESKGFNEYNFLSIFLPNSYNFYWDTDADTFRSRMLKEYTLFWNNSRISKLKKTGLNENQVMILASIVTQESKMKSELKTIAGVYMNRLNNNWLLQADPTVKYAAYQLPEYKDKIIRRILYKHLKIDSKFNTYKYKGLPPGLIAVPDISSIDAVLNYEKHKYFYFSADPNNIGYHNFSRTLYEHKNNAKKFHKYLDSKGIKK
ncbi:endolytic transglycosylase MltG [Flavobacteriaceae bacterium]|nr:endolytic transglycosylase MltG [Flavobacteriaceae bacterium]